MIYNFRGIDERYLRDGLHCQILNLPQLRVYMHLAALSVGLDWPLIGSTPLSFCAYACISPPLHLGHIIYIIDYSIAVCNKLPTTLLSLLLRSIHTRISLRTMFKSKTAKKVSSPLSYRIARHGYEHFYTGGVPRGDLGIHSFPDLTDHRLIRLKSRSKK